MDAVMVKVGGSLALQPDKLRSLCAKLTEFSYTHKLIILPGGGEFADAVRSLDERFHLSPKISHRMAILGMDQYGLLLSNLLAGSKLVDELEDLQVILNSGELPVFLPSTFLFSKDALENSWDVTSDTIAVYLADQLGLSKVILVTNVDGVYSRDPKKFLNAKLIRKLSVSKLLKMGERTSVDKFLPKLILLSQLECFVVNGLHPQRIKAILNGKETVCTQITRNPKKSSN